MSNWLLVLSLVGLVGSSASAQSSSLAKGVVDKEITPRQSGPLFQDPKSSPVTPRTPLHPPASDQFIVGMNPGGDVMALAAQLGADVHAVLPGPVPMGLLSVSQNSETMPGGPTIGSMMNFIEPVRTMGTPLEPGCAGNAQSSLPLSGSGCIAFFDGDPTPDEYFNQPALAPLDVSSLHALLVGRISTVAVIDTGIDASHPALLGRVLPFGYDFVDRDAYPMEMSNGIDDDGDGLIDEAFGHGTHIAGTIVLLNPDARILPLRVLDSDGNGTSFAVAEAIRYAVASGADVINLSLGMDETSLAVRLAIAEADAADVVVMAAAGNANTELVQFPARLQDVVAVAAVDAFDTKASFSSFGEDVELVAPGVNIYSAMPGEQYAWWSGTSMATSVASGAASLLHSLADNLYDTSGDKLLEDTSVSIEYLNPLYDDLLGDGRIDPIAAALLLFSEQ